MKSMFVPDPPGGARQRALGGSIEPVQGLVRIA